MKQYKTTKTYIHDYVNHKALREFYRSYTKITSRLLNHSATSPFPPRHQKHPMRSTQKRQRNRNAQKILKNDDSYMFYLENFQ